MVGLGPSPELLVLVGTDDKLTDACTAYIPQCGDYRPIRSRGFIWFDGQALLSLCIVAIPARPEKNPLGPPRP